MNRHADSVKVSAGTDLNYFFSESIFCEDFWLSKLICRLYVRFTCIFYVGMFGSGNVNLLCAKACALRTRSRRGCSEAVPSEAVFHRQMPARIYFWFGFLFHILSTRVHSVHSQL